MTAVRSGFRRVGLVAAAAALAVSSCASEEPQAPVVATAEETAELASQQPDNTPTTTAPQTPETTTADAVEAGAEPAECEEGQHSHDGEGCHGHSDTTDSANGSGGDSGAVCEDGLTRFEDLVTEEDNGCRPQVCDNGRGDDGHCLFAEEELTEEEAAALADADPLPWEEYGLEGCTEVALGMCDLDGVLHCHNTITGWAECPGQPSGDPCIYDGSDPLSLRGSIQVTGQVPEIVLEAGVYDIHVCLWDNDVATGEPEAFAVFIADSTYQVQSDAVWVTEGVAAGEWRAEIVVPEGFTEPLVVHVTPEGGGMWVVQFSLRG